MIDKSKIEKLIKVLEGTLDELNSHDDDMIKGKLSSKVLRGHIECMDKNINEIENLSENIVSNWRKGK